jgi:SSS family solute:Na+ symporter
MRAVDWLVMAMPMLIILAVALYTRRYVRSVADFMAGGRAAGRYLLCTARSEQGAGAVMFVGLFEVFAKAGFTTSWWQQITVPVALVISITGFVYYRYRQTRAMTLAQFFEMRYSRHFRIFTGALGFVAGICNFGIIPCIGARFFVNFLELPQTVRLGAVEMPTYLPLMACFLTASTLLTLSGGQVTILVINCLEGMFSQIGQVIVAIGLLATFSWVTMRHVLLAQPPGHSLVNPFDSFSTKDFNLWWVLMGLFLNSVYGTMAWQNNHAFNASGATPHDSRMGNILTVWKNFGLLLMVTLMGACVVTYLQHPDFAAGAASVRQAVEHIADHGIREQMRMPIALSHLLPAGLKGLVCAMILMGVISGDGIHLHSWSSILVQDVIMPLRKRPLPMLEHLRLLRAGIVGVAVFAFCFGALFKQTEYVLMWFQVTTAIFVGGAGSAIIGGLYWKRGTTAGAWVGLLTGSTLCISGILARQWNAAFPLNGTQISFCAALLSIAAYILASLATCRVPHNMDQLLHRGPYAVEPESGEAAAAVGTPRFNLRQIIGIDEHFTRSDRWVAYGIFWWSMFWFGVFLVGSSIYLVHPFSSRVWAQYWRVSAIWLPLAVTIVTTVWFTIGCTSDLRLFFCRLRGERVDVRDDGTVEHPNDPVLAPVAPLGEALAARGRLAAVPPDP